MIAMAIALVGYALYPTAPPRLLPEWGFTDTIQQFTGITVERGAGSALLNLYAAVPSMHVCFALMIGIPMSRLVRRWPAKFAWRLYPVLITFVVVATGNHYFTDVFLGALTAGVSALLADRLLARVRPDAWRFARHPGYRAGRRDAIRLPTRSPAHDGWPTSRSRHRRRRQTPLTPAPRRLAAPRGPDDAGADARAADRVAADAKRDLADRLRAEPRGRRPGRRAACSSSPGSRSSSAR